MRRLLLVGITLSVWATIHFYGQTLPYINVSPDIFSSLSLLLLILSVAWVHKKLQLFVFFACLAFVGWTYVSNREIHISFLTIAALTAPRIPALYASRAIEKFRKLLIPFYKKHFWISLGILTTILVFVFYARAFLSYFEGDEWIFFKLFRESAQSKMWFIQGFIDTFKLQSGILHATPLTSMLYVIQYRLFGLNFNAYFLQSLITHVAVSLSFGLLVWELTQSKKYAALSTILFATAAAGSQAVTWTLAAIYTQNALLLSLLSSVFLLRYARSKIRKDLYISSILLLAALLSKETAIAYIILNITLYLFKIGKKNRFFLKDVAILALVLVIFALSQLFFRDVSSLSEKIKTGEYVFHYITLSSKVFAQSILSNITFVRLSEWVTDMQFPYFNEQKEIRGTNYLMFIQVAATEFLSHIATLLLVMIAYLSTRHVRQKNLLKILVIFFFASVLPISFISFKFPWWKYQASIDSRHLYSVLPILVLLVILSLEGLSQFIYQKTRIAYSICMSLAVILIITWQFSIVQTTIASQQKDISLPERKNIVTKIQKDISRPPKQMIIYTTSNKTFYGFATLILPFQTAFSQIVPIIFDKPHHPHGHPYPTRFFQPDFIGDNGLVSEGYVEEKGYGLGYFLNINTLVKTLEKERVPLSSVYAFAFNGDTGKLENISSSIRNTVQEKISSRKIFFGWERHGSLADYFSFQTDPLWNIDKTNSIYSITHNGQPIMDIEVLPALEGQTFSGFVETYKIDNQPIEKEYTIEDKAVDLDLPRLFINPNGYPHIHFTVAGNGLKVFKITVHDRENAELIIRTMEFVDQEGEQISI